MHIKEKKKKESTKYDCVYSIFILGSMFTKAYL